MNTRKIGVIAALLCAVLVVAACSSSTKSSGGSSTAKSSGSSSSSAAAAGGITPAEIQFAATYIGGKANTAANSSLSPVAFGFVNQQGGTLSFPDATAGMEATVKFINDDLGGIDGHPLVAHTCFAASTTDVQNCATQMANDSAVKSVSAPLLLLNNQVFYTTLGSTKPMFQGDLVFPIDLTTPNVYSYWAGTGPDGLGIADFASSYLHAKRVIDIRTDNPAGLAAAQSFNADINAKGVKTVDVPVPEPGTAPQYTSAIRAANPQPGDAILLALTSIGASSVYDALNALNLTNLPVMASAAQALPPMPGHLKDSGSKDLVFPEGWYISDNGYTPFMPVANSNGEDTYVAAMNQYAKGTSQIGYAPYAFQEVMDTAKFMIESGGADATSAQLSADIKNYKGPAILTAGALQCGAQSATPNSCNFTIGWEQRKNNQWVSILDGINGKAINTLTGS